MGEMKQQLSPTTMITGGQLVFSHWQTPIIDQVYVVVLVIIMITLLHQLTIIIQHLTVPSAVSNMEHMLLPDQLVYRLAEDIT